MELLPTLSDLSGSQISKMAVCKLEVLLSQLVHEIAAIFDLRLTPESQAPSPPTKINKTQRSKPFRPYRWVRKYATRSKHRSELHSGIYRCDVNTDDTIQVINLMRIFNYFVSERNFVYLLNTWSMHSVTQAKTNLISRNLSWYVFNSSIKQFPWCDMSDAVKVLDPQNNAYAVNI